MKPSVPLLAPILRSDVQGRLLGELWLHPEKEFTGAEIAARIDTSPATVSRELSRLVEAGYATDRVSGRNRYVRVNAQHPLFGPLSEILVYAYGPLPVLRDVIHRVPGVVEAHLYGSYAARMHGEPGPDPRDLDVLVVGDSVDRAALEDAVDDARTRLRREVNPVVVTPQTWAEASSGFLRQLRARPLVPILKAGGTPDAPMG